MRQMLGAVLALLLACAALPAAAQDTTGTAPATAAPAAEITPEQKAAFEKIIRDYLIEHPEVVKEAILALQAREEADKADAQAAAVSRHAEELYNDPGTPVVGNPVGDVTIVEFFDYHCPYCKTVASPLDQLLKEDKGIRLVMKEFPILGEDSVLASRAALAAVEQGKYWEYHLALMAHRGKFTPEALKALAEKVGLDTAKLEAAIAGGGATPLIAANRELAGALEVSATPTFVIGGQVVEGAVPLEQLKALVKRARGG